MKCFNVKCQNVLFTLLAMLLISCGKDTVVSKEIASRWEFRSVSDTIWKPAKIPGTVHTDLLSNGEIEDPFYRLNEHDLQWIDKENWEYRTEFDLEHDEYNNEQIVLEFLGLDTYSEVFLNEQLILKSDNMFRTYAVDVKKYVKKERNELRIVFSSPIKEGLVKYDSLDFKIPVSNNDLAVIGKVDGEKQVSIFTRKAGYHFGWDWGPRLVSSGIWRPINLVTWSQFKIEDLFVQQNNLTSETADIVAHVTIQASEPISDAEIELELNGVPIKTELQNLDSGINTLAIPFSIENPKRWWPNGMGDQHLYKVTANISSSSSKQSDSQSRVIGLREIELVQEADSIGSSFYFKVNGIPTFMKGANYIPQDVFLPRVGNTEYDHILSSAKTANMNMLRVWGGGIYENDKFYDKCDSLGLLVWQDFMFACAMFPGDSSFLENVRQEAIDNVKRLRNHTSIALWCGNNEVLSAWKNWGWERNVIQEQSQEVADKIWKAYDDIFHKILPEVVNEYDSSRFYWPSSPGSEFGKTENLEKGDAHYWMVWWGKEPFENYNEAIPRFMSEFGFQSFPNMPTINKYTQPEDHDIYSEVMQSHQRSSIGNVTIDEYMKRYYRQPKDFESYIYASQLLQAHGIKVGIEAHRRNRERCMGSLYWQINDCWPVASWSSIDYYGNWKALHYQVKRSFETVILSFEEAAEELKVHIVSDSLSAFKAELELQAIDFSGNVVKTWKKDLVIKPNMSDHYLTLAKDELDIDKKQTILVGKLRIGSSVLTSEVHNLLPFKDLALVDPELSYSVTESKNKFIIELKAENFAKSVYLTDGTLVNFSDNYFDMLPKSSVEIQVDNPNQVTLSDFENRLQINSLFDTYN